MCKSTCCTVLLLAENRNIFTFSVFSSQVILFKFRNSDYCCTKTIMIGLSEGENVIVRFSRFYAISACDGEMDKENCYIAIAHVFILNNKDKLQQLKCT